LWIYFAVFPGHKGSLSNLSLFFLFDYLVALVIDSSRVRSTTIIPELDGYDLNCFFLLFLFTQLGLIASMQVVIHLKNACRSGPFCTSQLYQ
jgi:hypothetical protein